jgi:hypothetical protein
MACTLKLMSASSFEAIASRFPRTKETAGQMTALEQTTSRIQSGATFFTTAEIASHKVARTGAERHDTRR